jgi:hypothetical protein
MMRTRSLASCMLPLAATGLLLNAAAAAPSPSAQDIVQKNIAARGGLAAWRDVKTLTFEGTLDAGGKPSHDLPFVLREQRPRKSRLEIVFKEQTAIQVYDGSQGWKIRPFLNRNEVEPFTAAEEKTAAAADELDGPLVDSSSKGIEVALDGTESADGHPAYKLRLTMRDGSKRHLWVDANSFLEVKREGEPRKLDGHLHPVVVVSKDYHMEHGLNIAHLQETFVEGVKEPYKMTITRVTVNDKVEDALFQRPQLTAGSAPPTVSGLKPTAISPAAAKAASAKP